jgi:hypothetical protein
VSISGTKLVQVKKDTVPPPVETAGAAGFCSAGFCSAGLGAGVGVGAAHAANAALAEAVPAIVKNFLRVILLIIFPPKKINALFAQFHFY